MGRQKSEILNPKGSFKKDIDMSVSTLKKINKKMDSFLEMIDEGQVDTALHSFQEIERLSEKLVNINRLLVLKRGNPVLEEMVEKDIKEAVNVIIDFKDDVFHVNLGTILPKKEKGDPKYIRANLIRALDDYFFHNEKVFYREKCVIVFVHNYSSSRSYREYRDYDNIEINAVIDAIALFTLVDDSPYLLDHFYFSEVKDEDSTDIYIVKKSEFGEWLNGNYKKER